MKSIDIKGKKYVMVHERINYFRSQDAFRGYKMVTDIIELTDDRVVMSASILNEMGSVVAMGHAYENKDTSFITKTSYIEVCETSAWGRALACLGIGIDDSMASADEVANAINQR